MIGALASLHGSEVLAEDLPAATALHDSQVPLAADPRQLQLEVFINGDSRELIAEVRQDADGTLVIEPEQLRNVGIEPAKEAIGADGLVDIARLPDVSFEYNESNQTIYFDVEYDALSARVIDAHEAGEAAKSEPRSSIGALVNYTLFASTGGGDLDEMWSFEGASGWFEGRVFSPLGVITNSNERTQGQKRLVSLGSSAF